MVPSTSIPALQEAKVDDVGPLANSTWEVTNVSYLELLSQGDFTVR